MRKALMLLLIILIVLSALLFFSRSRTPTFKDARGSASPESVASLKQIELGGLKQTILIRGKDRTAPILLFLHGGPGMPMMYLAHKFQKKLEDRFVVVHWDQRGAGKSYSKRIPTASMNVEQFMADTHELIQKLKEEFGREKIFLAGHSWGSYLGMLVVDRYPELFYAFVSMGQVVDTKEGRKIADQFLRKQAKKAGDFEALEEMEAKGDQVREKWLFRFGAELHGETNWMPFVWTGLFSPEYSLFDIPKIAKGSNFSSKHMKYNAIEGELLDEIAEVAVPLYFFAGKHDYVTPSELIELYFQKIKAPKKKLIWFENSAHFPFYEEPRKFTEEMFKILDETYGAQKVRHQMQKEMETLKEVKLTIVYDNYELKEGLSTAWGFGCLVETEENTILFDGGGDSSALLKNMSLLGIDPKKIDAVFLSHYHRDHYGSLPALLEINNKMEVFVPAYFPASFKRELRSAGAIMTEIKGVGKIGKGLYTTGELGSSIIEQSLVISSSKGLIIMTGCAHPGIVNIIQRVRELFEEEIHLALGGFHLAQKSPEQLEEILRLFKEMGVEMVGPCHCSGDACRSLFQKAYGNHYLETGAGKVIEIISLK